MFLLIVVMNGSDLHVITSRMSCPRLITCLFSATHTPMVDERLFNHSAMSHIDFSKLERFEFG